MDFTEFEKSCMRELVSAPLGKQNLGDLFVKTTLNHGQMIRFSEKSTAIELLSREGDMPKLVNEMFTFFALVNYLKSNKYIYIHSLSNQLPGNVLSLKPIESHTIPPDTLPIDTTACKDIRDYTITFFHACTSLVELVKNDFVTPEKAQHLEQMNEARKQTSRATLALVLSGASVFITVVAFFWSAYNNM